LVAEADSVTNGAKDSFPVPSADVYAFVGGLHFATMDVYRERKCEDYFLNQIEGF
jgi:hypothetical protein